MKLSRLLCALLALAFLLSCIPASFAEETYPTYYKYDDMVDPDTGVTFYDLMQGENAGYTDSTTKFYENYLTKETKTRPSVLSRWQSVYDALLSDATGSKFTEYKQGADVIKDNDRWASRESSGFAGSLKDAGDTVLKAVNGSSAPQMMAADGLSTDEQNVFYYCKSYYYTGEEGRIDPSCTTGAYALLFYNFRIAQAVDDDYIQTNIMDREDYVLSSKDPKASFSQGFTNNSSDTVSASASLTTNASESVTLTDSSSKEYTFMHTVNPSGSLKIGKQEWPLGGSIGFQYSHTWGNVAGTSYSKAETKTTSTETSSSMTVQMPPYTAMTMLQETGEGTMNLDVSFPVVLMYDVKIIFFEYTDAQTFTVTYSSNKTRSSVDARTDLYQRAVQSAVDPDQATYGSTGKANAELIYYTVPTCQAPTNLKYDVKYTNSGLYGISPLANLTQLKLAKDEGRFLLKLDESMDVGTIGVEGLNKYDSPYYGFDYMDENLGGWVLLDDEGKAASYNETEKCYETDYFRLQKDSITGKMLLTATKCGGKAYIRYMIKEKAYLDVEKTPVGSTEEPTYIDPDTIANHTTIEVLSTNESDTYKVEASGSMSVFVGSEYDLNDTTDIRAMVIETKDGKQYKSGSITWETQNTDGKITIETKDNNAILKATKAGEYKIRATWNGLYSDWLTVTAEDPVYTIKAEGEMTILVNEECDLNDNDQVKAMVLDEREKQWEADITWEVQELYNITVDNKTVDYKQQSILKATKAGEYHIRATWKGLCSDWLTVTVIDSRALADDYGFQASGAMSIYVNQEYDLTQTTDIQAIVIDRKTGKQHSDAKITWETQNTDGVITIDDNSVLKATKVGTYYIRATWEGLYSDWLTVTVENPTYTVQAKGAMTIYAEDEYDLTTTNQVKAMVLDKSGKQIEADIVWETQEVYDITIDANSVLVAAKAGEYHIRATWQGLYSEWLTVTAKDLKGSYITIKDTKNILANCHLSEDYPSRSFNLANDIDITLYDGDGSYLPLVQESINWYMTTDEGKSGFEWEQLSIEEAKNFVVSNTGTYYFRAQCGDAVSNTLTLKVDGCVLREIIIADDPLEPMLNDYLIGSGDDTFDLSSLNLSGKDQYGDRMTVDPRSVIWYVNGEMLSDTQLQVTKVGTYEICCAFTVGSNLIKSNTLTLNVLTRVKNITLSAEKAKIAVGDVMTLVPYTEPAGEPDIFVFYSSNPSVATVDEETGFIKAFVCGETTITVKSASGYTVFCELTVVEAPQQINLSESNLLIGLGETRQLTMQLLPSGSTSTVTFSSDDESIVTIDESGLVTALQLGETIISATTHNGLTADCFVNVTKKATDIEAPENVTLGLGETYDLAKETDILTEKRVTPVVLTYESRNPEIVSVTEGGMLTANAKGETTIVITSYNKLHKLVDVSVYDAPKSVTLSAAKKTLVFGDTLDLHATIPEGSAGAITYKSSKPAVATVSENGIVKAIAKGTTVITATAYNGKKATCKITVSGKNPLTLKVSGKIDIFRPDTCVTLTPSFTDSSYMESIAITAKYKKKDLGDVTELFDIKKSDNGPYEIRRKADETLNPSATYTAVYTVDADGKTFIASKTFKVVKGKVKVQSDPKTVSLTKSDAKATAQATLTLADTTLAPISNVTVKNKSFDVKYLGDGKIEVTYKNGVIPKKGTTLKLNVFLKGYSEKAATVKLKVKLTD